MTAELSPRRHLLDYSNVSGATDIIQLALCRHGASGKLVAIWTTVGGGDKIHAAVVDESTWIVSATLASMGISWPMDAHLQPSIFYDPSSERIIFIGQGGENIYSWTVTAGEAADPISHSAFDFSTLGNYMLSETNRAVVMTDGYFGGFFSAFSYDITAGFHMYRMVGTTCTHEDYWELDPDNPLYYSQQGDSVAADAQGDKVFVVWGIHNNIPDIDAIRMRIGNRSGSSITWENYSQIDLNIFPRTMHGRFIDTNRFLVVFQTQDGYLEWYLLDTSGTAAAIVRTGKWNDWTESSGGTYPFVFADEDYNYVSIIWREYTSPNKAIYMRLFTKEMVYSTLPFMIIREDNTTDAMVDWYEPGFYENYPCYGWFVEGEEIQFVLAMYDETEGDTATDTEAYMWTITGGPFEPFWTNYHGQTEADG